MIRVALWSSRDQRPDVWRMSVIERKLKQRRQPLFQRQVSWASYSSEVTTSLHREMSWQLSWPACLCMHASPSRVCLMTAWLPLISSSSFIQFHDCTAFSWSLSVADFSVILPPVETGRAGRLTKQGKKTCKGRALESFGEEVREWRVEVVRVDKNGEYGCVKEMVQCGGPLLNKWGGLKGDLLVHLRIKEKGNGVVLPSKWTGYCMWCGTGVVCLLGDVHKFLTSLKLTSSNNHATTSKGKYIPDPGFQR